MYDKLADVALKSGEQVELGVVMGPDAEWAGRLDGDLLAHKSETWRWGNRFVLNEAVDMDAYFYILHRKGKAFANVMTLEYEGVGILGHVYTRPKDRRQGAASLIFEALMPHFRARGGQALILGTGYDSPPYHIYRAFGFESLEPLSGTMAYYAAGEEAFREAYFAPGETVVEPLGASHYPVAPILFSGAYEGTVRSAAMRLFGRTSTEWALMTMMREALDHEKGEKSARAAVLRIADRPAVAGLALWGMDATWPNTCVVDVFCHPDFWNGGAALLSALDLPDADRYVAYCDVGWTAKEHVLATAGFKQVARLPNWVAQDRARTGCADVGMWVMR